MVRSGAKGIALFGKYAAAEARKGHTMPLAVRFLESTRGGPPLSQDEIDFIVEIIERADGRRGKRRLKEIERFLIRESVEDWTRELGSKEAAVSKVMAERGKKRSTVFAVLATQKSKK